MHPIARMKPHRNTREAFPEFSDAATARRIAERPCRTVCTGSPSRCFCRCCSKLSAWQAEGSRKSKSLRYGDNWITRFSGHGVDPRRELTTVCGEVPLLLVGAAIDVESLPMYRSIVYGILGTVRRKSCDRSSADGLGEHGDACQHLPFPWRAFEVATENNVRLNLA